MSERIVIDFDDEKDKPKPEENRIVIDLDEEKKVIDIEKIEESREERILNSKINSYYCGGPDLSKYVETDIRFPEGIDHGFRKKFSTKIKDEFFNSILENNRFIILSSGNGSVYLIDRFTGKVQDKIFFEHENFEKTGLVYDNAIYLNSLKRIIKLSESDGEKIKSEDVYSSPKDFFIWSSINRYGSDLIFNEYSLSSRTAVLRIVNPDQENATGEFSFNIHSFVSDKVCIAEGSCYVLFDTNILVYDLEKRRGTEFLLDIKTDENSFIFYLNHRLYITSHLNELYYLDLPPVNFKFRNTGIKNNYINSVGGFGDNIFAGTLLGWKYYKASGLEIHGFEDEYENKIECISKNVLVVSKKNKIVFCNLNRFQEAESYVISSNERNEAVEIVSAILSNNEIFVLTKNGVLECFTNDKMNIHI
ncbi:MAG: hypothetical protein SGI89_01010 [bacterium]|nr:hypothetical protein [bacterium]